MVFNAPYLETKYSDAPFFGFLVKVDLNTLLDGKF